MRRVVRAFWGPREESVEALARRWRLTLDRLAELLPAAGVGTWQQVHTSGPETTALHADEALLAAALRAEREADGWTEAALSVFSEGEPGWQVEVRGASGGTSEFLHQSIVITIKSPDDAEIPDAELLTNIAELWHPDVGDVIDDDVFDALEDDAGFKVGEPSVGWIGYLSPGRAALVPDGLGARRKVLRDGGEVLTIAERGDTEAVVRAYLRLREAGALRPLPQPMERTRMDAHVDDTERAMTAVRTLLAGPVPAEKDCETAVLWEGPWLMGVYEEAWAAAESQANARLAAVTDALDHRWGPHRSVGMRVPIFRDSSGTPMPPLFQTLVDRDYLGDLSVWGPVGDQGRYVGVSLNQCDGDAPMIVAAVVSDHPIVELMDEDD